MSEMRRDPIRGHWSLIAPGRQQRPEDYSRQMLQPTFEEICPFCPGNESLTPPEIDAVRPTLTKPNEKGWLIRLVPNRYPALSSEDESWEGAIRDPSDLHRSVPAFGVHDIVVATPEHSWRASKLGVEHWDQLLAMCQYRMERLSQDSRIKQVLLFQNHGAEAGASRSHAHLQIMGLPLVSKSMTYMLLNSQDYYARHRRCLFCDALERELSDKSRIVICDEAFVAYTPWASRFPYEMCVTPRSHHESFLKLVPESRRRLAGHLRDVLQRLEKLFGEIPYNWILHTAPAERGDKERFHWHIEILPRLSSQAGYEWGSEGFINTTPPEQAAKDLCEA